MNAISSFLAFPYAVFGFATCFRWWFRKDVDKHESYDGGAEFAFVFACATVISILFCAFFPIYWVFQRMTGEIDYTRVSRKIAGVPTKPPLSELEAENSRMEEELELKPLEELPFYEKS